MTVRPENHTKDKPAPPVHARAVYGMGEKKSACSCLDHPSVSVGKTERGFFF